MKLTRQNKQKIDDYFMNLSCEEITYLNNKYFNKPKEAIEVIPCCTQLPVDRLQELIEETYTWQVQDLDADTFEESLKLGIREGALAVKHYIDDKGKAIV